MYLHYEKSLVVGHLKQDGGGTKEIREEILCRSTQDPLLLAMRRNNELAACDTVTVQLIDRFSRYVDEDEYRDRGMIPFLGGSRDFDW